MGRARDPTVDVANLQAAARSWETVAAHLEAFGSAGDCGAELTDDVTLTIMATGEVIDGRAAVAALLTSVHRSAFSAPPVVVMLVAGAERAMIEAEFIGGHTSEFAGIAPTTGCS